MTTTTLGAVHREPPVTTARALLLIADTGGGHRACAEALREELEYGDRMTGIIVDPLTGPGVSPPVRWLFRRYGPLVRVAPALWALLFHATNHSLVRPVVEALITRAVRRPLADAIDRHRPEVVVVLHPLLVAPAARHRHGRVITVITDIGNPHRTWWHRSVDEYVTPRPGLPRHLMNQRGTREHVFGLPVRRQFVASSAVPDRSQLGLSPERFVVLINGGGEGVRGTGRWARALVRGKADVDVIVICGRNERLRGRLSRLEPRPGRQLLVTGFVDDIATWMRTADVLVAKAGPGIIAEAAALGLPLLLAGSLPGQEAGNSEAVVRGGAGIRVSSTRDLLARVTQLSARPDLLLALHLAALRSGRPTAGALTADLITNPKENP
ncbi:glycosyltransferase [Kribbella albertanoniae]|uniref:Glycosyltransferase n=1 Tax=Kribbella albertanoniae TaxID=1266829 RepID=A0A4R4QIJ5_9ACTN|nr:glycosyltransferase [Kribbella albertanoniae]TDC35042.1 glycosyltransferase [Kribbella albertanoniae]